MRLELLRVVDEWTRFFHEGVATENGRKFLTCLKVVAKKLVSYHPQGGNETNPGDCRRPRVCEKRPALSFAIRFVTQFVWKVDNTKQPRHISGMASRRAQGPRTAWRRVSGREQVETRHGVSGRRYGVRFSRFLAAGALTLLWLSGAQADEPVVGGKAKVKITKPAPAATCGDHGTNVHFEASPTDAANKALKEEKLVMVLHISGYFEDPDFT